MMRGVEFGGSVLEEGVGVGLAGCGADVVGIAGESGVVRQTLYFPTVICVSQTDCRLAWSIRNVVKLLRKSACIFVNETFRIFEFS